MGALDNLSTRERQLATGLGAVFVALVCVLAPLRLTSWISKKEQQNEELRDAIQRVLSARGRIAARRAALGDVASRYSNKAPQLGVLIDTISKGVGLEIASQTDLPPVPRGKLYTERATKVSIQKTGLKPLANFLERLETSGHPVAVTGLDLSKHSIADTYTVSMTISAYDRAEPAAPAASTARPAGSR